MRSRMPFSLAILTVSFLTAGCHVAGSPSTVDTLYVPPPIVLPSIIQSYPAQNDNGNGNYSNQGVNPGNPDSYSNNDGGPDANLPSPPFAGPGDPNSVENDSGDDGQ